MSFFQPTLANKTVASASYDSNPFIYGFQLALDGTTKFNVKPGTARSYASNYVIESTETLSCDTAIVGPGGCFPLPINRVNPTVITALNVYIVAKSSGTTNGSLDANIAPVLIVATGDNFLPAGYDVWRKVGTVVRSANVATLAPITQSGTGEKRTYVLTDGTAIINGGISTTMAPLSYSLAASGVCNPYFTDSVLLTNIYATAVAGDIANMAPTAGAAAIYPYAIKGEVAGVSAATTGWYQTTVSAGNEVINFYKTSNAAAGLSVRLVGWSELLGLQAM